VADDHARTRSQILTLLEELPAPKQEPAVQPRSVRFEEPMLQSERIYGNLFQSVYAMLGQAIYRSTCSSAVR
jgi:hypothetical protein